MVLAIVNYYNIGPRSRLTVTYSRVTRGIVLPLTISTFDHRSNRECQRGNPKFRRKHYRGSEKSCRIPGGEGCFPHDAASFTRIC